VLEGGAALELRTYAHRTRRNILVVEAVLDCTRCAAVATVGLEALSGQPSEDVVFADRSSGAGGPRRLLGVLRAHETNLPSTAALYDTNYTLGDGA
jgi:hypothetical protein